MLGVLLLLLAIYIVVIALVYMLIYAALTTMAIGLFAFAAWISKYDED